MAVTIEEEVAPVRPIRRRELHTYASRIDYRLGRPHRLPKPESLAMNPDLENELRELVRGMTDTQLDRCLKLVRVPEQRGLKLAYTVTRAGIRRFYWLYATSVTF